ncbi:superoxide dismutase [Candidatus Pacearchaeota archaeon]|nr:superoxide dismutase [Candidatus Pacearchaeota archaeon]
MAHELPKLSYAYDALEPYIDKETMQIHYGKHHQTYVDKLNTTLVGHEELLDKPIEEILKEIDSVSETIRTAVRNFGGGHFNHSFFWTVLKKNSKPNGEILKAIKKDFQSYEVFVEKFKGAAVSHFGSGWVWLVLNPRTRKLEIMQTHDQESPISQGKIPLLVVDVWEHAYYLKYQNKRPEYVDAFLKVINWEKVNENYLKAIQG